MPSTRNCYVLFILFFLITQVRDASGQMDLRVEHILLPNKQEIGAVHALFKDYQGYMWIGSESGLFRYDGNKVLGAKEVLGTDQLNSFIYSIGQDTSGRIWVGSSEGLYVISPGEKKTYRVYPDYWKGENRFEHPEVMSVLVKNDRIYFGSYYGLEEINFVSKTTHTYPVYIPFSLPSNRRSIGNLTEDKQGNLWFGTINGLGCFNPESGKCKRWDLACEKSIADHSENSLGTISLYHDSLFIMGTWASGLKLFNIHSGQITTHLYSPTGSISGTENIILSVIPSLEKDGLFFLGTGDHGVGTYDARLDSIAFFDYNPQSWQSINSRFVRTLFIDDDHLLWIGTETGLQIHSLIPQNIVYHNLLPRQLSGHNISIISGTAVKNSDDFYFGTYSSGFWKYNQTTHTIHHIKSIPDNRVGIILSIHSSHEYLYVSGTAGNFIYNIKTQEVRENKNLPSLAYMSAHTVNDSMVWFLSFRNKVVQYNTTRQSWTYLPFSDSSSVIQTDISSVFISSDGTYWVATYRHGLGIYNPVNKSFHPVVVSFNQIPVHDIYDIESDSRGNIWFSTFRMGLFCYSPFTHVVENIRTFNGTHANSIFNMALDKKGYLWLSTRNGLIEFDPISRRSSLYSVNEGLETNNLENGLFLMNNGHIFIPHFHGFSIVDPLQTKPFFNQYPLLINSFLVNGKSRPGLNNASYTLRYFENDIELDVSFLSYRQPEFNQYAYKLEGYQPNWVYTTNNRIFFSKLPPGQYTLRVKAAGSSGEWNQNEITMRIEIVSPFWQTWWFYLILILVFMVLMYAIYRYRLKQIKRIYHVRNKIAGDLHDDIGSALSSIKMYAGFLKGQEMVSSSSSDILGKIETTSAESLENMGDIVWSINPKKDGLEHLIQKMKGFSDNLLKPLQMEVVYDMLHENPPLSMEYRRHVYLFYKEAINNIAKYSGATLVKVVFKRQKGWLHLSVADNGKGFDTGLNSAGNGLRNMKERAHILKGNFQLHSSASGTTIELIFKPT